MGMKRGFRDGFTLMEISIALLTIALIAGGVLTGKEMIHQAKLRGILKESEQYSIATNNFQTKYRALPGDMPNATDYWGTAPGGCPASTIFFASRTDARTCNGNGNSMLQMCDPDAAATQARPETFTFWQHLANAKLIQGTYTGVSNIGAGGPFYGSSFPESAMGGSGWMPLSIGLDCTWAEIPPGRYRFVFSVMGYLNMRFALVPLDALSLDQKIDDGKPGTGKVVGRWNATCIGPLFDVNMNLDSATYDITKTDPGCDLHFQKQ